MDAGADSITRRVAAAALACAVALAITIVMTWPLAAGFGRLGRTTPGDGPYAIWNIAWVAHALTSEPAGVLDANIFHPRPLTLTYSEINLVGGMVAVPGWLATRNPYVAHNSALFFAFVTSALGAWLLARKVTGSSAAGAVAGTLYAFCPYFFAHTPHIQLLMGGGVPLALLMVYRIAEGPSLGRGAQLGVVLAAQALACAYYGIFGGLLVGYAAIVLAITRARWRQPRYWGAFAAGAVVSVLLVLPFFLPFIDMQQSAGFRRTLAESAIYSANLPSYLASAAHAHAWLLAVISRWPRFVEVLFPGFLTLALAAVGAAAALRGTRAAAPGAPRDRETLLLFGTIGVLGAWASFGPKAGLYSVFYHLIPLFSFLRAPGRLGPVVMLALAVIAAIGVRALLARLPPRRRVPASVLLVGLAMLELNQVPFAWERAPALPSPYRMLAQLPRGPVAEFPFYGSRPIFHLHTQYMLNSAAHWQPLVNGYSDYFPPDFREAAPVLETFPSRDAFNTLRRRRVRYITVHWEKYGPRREEIAQRLEAFQVHLQPLASDSDMTLYEVVSYP